MGTRMVGGAAGIVGGIAWLSKLAVMAAQGGPDASSIPEAIAFFVGLVGVLVASAATADYMLRTRSLKWRVPAAGVGVVVAVVVIGLGQAALTALPGDAWIQQEAVFGLAGLAMAVIGAGALVERRREKHG